MGLSPIKEGQERILKLFLHKTAALVNCAQLITVTGSPTGGTFTLVAADPVGTFTTSAIAYNASAGTVQSALEALTPIGSGNVSVSGSAGGPWTATFIVALAATPINLMVRGTNSLTGGTTPDVTVTSSAVGVGTIQQYYYMGLSQSTRTTLTEAVALTGITEVTGTGYKRQPVKTNTSEWVALYTGGFWQATSGIVTFTATAANWTIQRSIFMTDVPAGTAGRVLDVRDITAITLGNGESQGYDAVLAWKNTA